MALPFGRPLLVRIKIPFTPFISKRRYFAWLETCLIETSWQLASLVRMVANSKRSTARLEQS